MIVYVHMCYSGVGRFFEQGAQDLGERSEPKNFAN